ncbi:MAG TPA: site-specific DNA-methyltransferase [Pyrinomonadaceae bacterium]|jgi:adenine-specific DNA-methyltransferase
MARKKTSRTVAASVVDFRHEDAKRKNNPPAKIAGEGQVPLMAKIEYQYSPRRPPVLRFDPNGSPDQIPKLLAEARHRKLDEDEIKILAEALRTQEPWLEWAGKRETPSFAVDPVALHIHERVSAQAILKIAAQEDVQRGLFADPQQSYNEAVQFYRHNIDWTNRLILGDSLQVMASLARREDLAGKVQMMYIDPPYGIKFASNFQPEIGRRDVKDKEQDLTREPEMVKAYRDTWNLGLHSYLSYLRDRFIIAKELLADTGSIFVQIGDENLHTVRSLLDEVFNAENFVSVIQFKKTGGFETIGLPSICDYLLWYAKSKPDLKFNRLFDNKVYGEGSGERYNSVLLKDGSTQPVSRFEISEELQLPDGAKLYLGGPLTSDGAATNPTTFEFQGRILSHKPNQHWKTTPVGMYRLAQAERIFSTKDFVNYRLFIDDFAATPLSNMWTDTMGTAERDKAYVVQTTTKIVERCILMTTDPGDLVLDPTCGSGTTAYVAEQWGRRWITTDTSRVAVAIARQRLMTAKFDFYKLRPLSEEDRQRNPSGVWLSDPNGEIEGKATLAFKTVPHITLKSIAQNTNLDPIFAKHEPVLNVKLAACNVALSNIGDVLRQKLRSKLLAKQKAEGKKSITDADRRRWELPKAPNGWEHWQVPFDTDEDWPKELSEAVRAYRQGWRDKMDEVNASINANAEQEELFDQPEMVRGVVRVSGPLTVEAVQPPEMSLGDVLSQADGGMFGGEPDLLDQTFEVRMVEPLGHLQVKNVVAYLEQMTRLLRSDGVRFPNNRQMRFTRLDALSASESGLHAEGRWITLDGADDDPEGRATVCVAFGPQYGPVTAKQVEDLIRSANRRGYDDLVVAGFSFDGPAQTIIEESQHPRLRIHMAHIRPDVNPGMQGLLKEQPGSQLFTVFGQPRTSLSEPDAEGMYTITMEGVDIYDPVSNIVLPTSADKVAAWFLDSDYDGWTFCITQAFFPDRTAWDKLSKALNGPGGVIDNSRFEAFSGTVSLPFPAGKNCCVAVKVIDPRGNEVMRVHKLPDK